MKINLNKAHILTKSDNTKLYETSELIRLTAMYDSKLANALKARLASPACSETEYRKAISDSIVVVKPHKPHKQHKPQKVIVNEQALKAYVLPIGTVFNSGLYTTFRHDQLGQLDDSQQAVIKADLKPTDTLSINDLKSVCTTYYEVKQL